MEECVIIEKQFYESIPLTPTTAAVNQEDVPRTSSSYCYFNRIGDGYCDDDCNFPECGYDGGDCCGPDVKFNYCWECICKEN